MTKIQLKRSSALTSGSARVPTSGQLDYGELAVNYNSSDPQLFFKDSAGSVVSFFDKYAALDGATFSGDVAFSANVDFDGAVTIKGDSTNGSGKLSLTCEQNTHTVNIKAPAHSSAANYTLTLPSSAGTSTQVLTTDGSGNLSWAVSSMSTADKNKLDGIEAGATADQTAAEILTAIKTVDGSGSGLDADLLDGISSESFLRSDINDTTSGNLTIDKNTPRLDFKADQSGSNVGGRIELNENGNLWVNAQGGKDLWLNWLSPNSASSYADLNIGDGNSGSYIFRVEGSSRTVSINTNTAWHAGNDGSGSGLDADNLDGSTWTSGTNAKFSRIEFSGVNGNSGNGVHNYAIYQEGGSWSSPYPDLVIGYHTGVKIGGHTSYNGTRFYSDAPGRSGATELFSVGNGDNHVRVINNLYVGGNTAWHAGNDGSGSGLDADNLDGYTWDTSGKNLRGQDIYADSWLRNYNSGNGLYNQANDAHFYSPGSQYWHINGNSGDITNGGLIFYDQYNSSHGHSTGRKGYVYWDSSGFGLLSSAGSWGVNIPPGATSSNALVVGGGASSNHYNAVSSARMSFGGGNDFIHYHLGTNSENYGGTYTKLDLRWHTGIRMGAQSQYGGIRLFNNEDLSSLQWQFNGSSGYTYKHVWLNTTSNGIYSVTNGAHIYPNITSSYAQWQIDGVRNGWAGLMINYTYHSALMYDSSGNGGIYQENGSGWHTYFNRGNTCLGVNTSTTSSSYGLYVNGAIYATSNITAYSDARKKTNIETIKSALNKILNLRGVTYNKINLDKTVNDKTEIGVIAQEVEKVVPEVVTYAEDVDEYGVSYGNLTALLIEAVKELKIELNELKESLA